MSKRVSYTKVEFKGGVRFNLFGLVNTPKDNSIYTIKATIGNTAPAIIINNVDWENSH